jgi:hypothetical protein
MDNQPLTLAGVWYALDGLLWNTELNRPTQKGDPIDKEQVQLLETRFEELRLAAHIDYRYCTAIEDRFALIKSFFA